MTLIQLLLAISVTAAVCGAAGLSAPVSLLITLVVACIAMVLIEKCFPSPWKPIEELKSRLPADHELMVEAKRRAADSLPLFWSLCSDGVPIDAMVRAILTDRTGESEELWVFLLELPDADGRIHVHLSESPRLVDYEFNDAEDLDFHIHKNQIVDWSIEQPHRKIRGAFTTFAVFEFFEQSVGSLPKRTKRLRERFVDARDVSHLSANDV